MPDFPQHFLRENQGNKRPIRILFYDCETQTEESYPFTYHTMYMGWSCFVRRDLDENMESGTWVFHDSQEHFCSYVHSLYSEKTVLYIVGHNVFFDLQSSGFFFYFREYGWRLNFLYDGGLSYILILKKGKCAIKVASTTNYFAESLASLGKVFGIEKKEVSFDGDDYDTIKDYCHRDVEIIIRIMREWFSFIDDHDCGSFGLTRASQSFRAYRHRFMATKIGIHKDNKVIQLERLAYMGGRTEAFFIGEYEKGDVSVYDVNSMYPAIMRENFFPYQLIDHLYYPDLDTIGETVKSFCVVAHICVDTDEPCYAVRGAKKILFPTGRFRCYVTTVGLQYAIAKNHLLQVYEISVYKKARLFKDYVDYFYPLKVAAKRAGDTVTGAMVKIFLNSLYGKFGQRYTVTEIQEDEDGPDYFRMDYYDHETGEYESRTNMFGSVIIEKGEVNGRDSLVSVAAHVTEYGRFILWNKIKRCKNNESLYCDTDSLFVGGDVDNDNLFEVDPVKLGAWSLDKMVKRLIIYGCKDYVADGEIKIKGVPKKAIKDEQGCYVYDQFAGQTTHLRAGESKRFIVRQIKKTLARVYDKGMVRDDARVTPWVMVDDRLYQPVSPFSLVEQ